MNIALWIIQVILAFIMIMAGGSKVFQFEKFKEGMDWVTDKNRGLVTFIGISEVLGGIGLILPLALNIAPILTPIAAVGLAIIMLLAAIFHGMRKEYQAIIGNIVFLVLALLIAIGRF